MSNDTPVIFCVTADNARIPVQITESETMQDFYEATDSTEFPLKMFESASLCKALYPDSNADQPWDVSVLECAEYLKLSTYNRLLEIIPNNITLPEKYATQRCAAQMDIDEVCKYPSILRQRVLLYGKNDMKVLCACARFGWIWPFVDVIVNMEIYFTSAAASKSNTKSFLKHFISKMSPSTIECSFIVAIDNHAHIANIAYLCKHINQIRVLTTGAQFAIKWDNPNIIDCIVHKMSNFSSLFYDACTMNSVKIIKYLITHYIDPSQHSDTGFRLSASSGAVEVMRYLYREYPQYINIHNHNIIRSVTTGQHYRAIMYLCDLGIDPHADNNHLIRWAVLRREFYMLIYILAHCDLSIQHSITLMLEYVPRSVAITWAITFVVIVVLICMSIVSYFISYLPI